MNQHHILTDGRVLTIVRLAKDQLAEIQALQRKVIDALSSESFLQPLTEEEFLYILQGKGIMLGAYSEGRLIAFRAMLEPEIDSDHLGIDAGLKNSELSRVIYSEISNVDPEFRGNKLQLLLGKIIMKEVDEQRFSYICTTVAPFNIASLKDKFALGMEIVALKEKYGGLLRYVLMKTVSNTVKEKDYTESRYIGMEQTQEQQQYLLEGWIGIGLKKQDDKWFVCFEK